MKITAQVISYVSIAIGALAVNQALAQGTVVFKNFVPGVIATHVYRNPDAVVGQLSGNGPNELPPGTQNWSGFALISGSSYLAAL